MQTIVKIALLCVLLFSSCASQAEREWSEWEREGVPAAEMKWHICKEELDGPDLHLAGFCYQANECRTRKTIFGNERKECRNKLLICKWGDIDCILYHNIDSMVIEHQQKD